MIINDFLATKEFPGRILFAKVWGSRSHNTDTNRSDWDFSGVYVVPTKSILGMDKVTETVANKEGAEKPDFSFHEIGKFCNLLLVGNPGILEMLYTEIMCVGSPEWDALKAERNRYLSVGAVKQYLGYAEGQLRRLKAGSGLHTTGGQYNEKWAYHMIRLLYDAKRIVEGGHPVVWKDDGAERNYLMMIRNGAISKQDVEDTATKLVAEIDERLPICGLPDIGDKNFLEDWLIGIRLKDL
jgi:predicted nucleotidyltransferase